MAITDGLLTLAEARVWIYQEKAPTAPVTNDSVIEDFVEAATPVIENITGPLVVRSRTFTVDGGSPQIALPSRFTSVTSVTESGTVITDFQVDASAGILIGGTSSSPRSFTSGVRNIVVVVSVGSAVIPANVKQAAGELIRHWWQNGWQGQRPQFAADGAPTGPMMSGVPTRRLEELLAATQNVAGFA